MGQQPWAGSPLAFPAEGMLDAAPLRGAQEQDSGLEWRWSPGWKVNSNCSYSDSLLDRLHCEWAPFQSSTY